MTLTIADELKRARAIAEIGPCTICTNKFQLSDQQGRVVFFMLSRLLLFQMESHLCRQTSGQTTWQGFRGRKRRRVSKYFTLKIEGGMFCVEPFHFSGEKFDFGTSAEEVSFSKVTSFQFLFNNEPFYTNIQDGGKGVDGGLAHPKLFGDQAKREKR